MTVALNAQATTFETSDLSRPDEAITCLAAPSPFRKRQASSAHLTGTLAQRRSCHEALQKVRFAATCTVSRIPTKPDDAVPSPWFEQATGASPFSWADDEDDGDSSLYCGLWDSDSLSPSSTPLTSPSPSTPIIDDMTGSWSSAATGKPQLSYAERLRKAKEDAASVKAPQDADVKSTSGDKALQADANSTASSVPASSSVMTPATSQANSVAEARPEPSDSGRADTPAVADEAASVPVAQIISSNVNVWEARRLQQQQKSQEMTTMPVGNVDESQDASAPVETKAQKKKKRQGGDASLLQDTAAWPQPNITTSTNDAKQSPRPDSSTQDNGQPSSTDSSNRRSMNLHDLDILRVPGASDKVKRGKQWVPIVPNVTHSTPASSSQQQRRSKSSTPSQAGSEVVGAPQGPRMRSQDMRTPAMARERSISGASDAFRNSKPKKPWPKSYNNSSSNDVSAGGSDSAPSRAPESPAGHSPDLQSRLQKLSVSTERYPGQAQRYTNPSPRGRRGRAYTKRLGQNGSMSPADSRSRASSVSQFPNDGEPSSVPVSVPASVVGAQDDAQSQAPSSRPPSRGAPRGPRLSFSNGGSRRQHNHVASEQMSVQAYGPYHYPAMTSQPGVMPTWGMFSPPQMHGVPAGTPMLVPVDVDRTPEEMMPKGLDAATEPTQALLAQIEFYFSNQNLQGDFFLRKHMDLQGFVPVAFIAQFKRVKTISGDNCLEVIRNTLPYSRVLQLNEDGTKVRKAMGWEQYVLGEGQRPQESMGSQPPTPHMLAASPMMPGAGGPVMMVPYWVPPPHAAAMSPGMSPPMLAPMSPSMHQLPPPMPSPHPSNSALSPLHLHAEMAPPSADGSFIRSPYASPEPSFATPGLPSMRGGYGQHYQQSAGGRGYGRGGNNGGHRGGRRTSVNRGGYHNTNGGTHLPPWQSQGAHRYSGAAWMGAPPHYMAAPSQQPGGSAAMSRQSSQSNHGNGNGLHSSYYSTPSDIYTSASTSFQYPEPPALHDQDDDVQVLGAQAAGIAQQK